MDVRGESGRLERLESITDAALAHLDFDALLSELLHRIRGIVDVDTVAILLLDEERNELVARATIGIEEDVEHGIRIPVGRGFAGRVAAERRPVLLRDVDHADVLDPLLRRKRIKTLLGVPLLVGRDVIGVLQLGSLTPRHFAEDDVASLQVVADRVSVAIEHARLLDAERQARRRLEDVQAITDAALAHLDLDTLLAELLSRIRSILDIDTAAILLLDDERNELVARAAVGIEEEVEQGVRIPVGRGFAGRVAAERRPVLLADVDHSDVLNPLLRQKRIKTLLGVPLLVEGEVLGVLHVGSLTPRQFHEYDVGLLQVVADRASVAIAHANTFEAERKARAQLERVQAITDAALAHLELEELLQALLVRTRDTLGVDTCAILLLDEERRELVARAAVGIEEEVEQGVRIPLGRGFAGRVAAQRRPVVLPDVDTADIYNPILRQKGIKTLLGVPLVVRDEVIGVLHVGTLVHSHFGAGDVQLLQLVAERAALAIEKARVHDQMVRLDQMKLNFVAIASHELRTPATAVYGMLTTLRARGDEIAAETRRQLEEAAWQQSDRLRRLIEQLLDLSRLDANSIAVEPQPLVLQRLLSELVAADEASDGDVVLDVDPDLAVVADPLVIERVITNVVGNARRYGRPPIRISAEQRDRHLRIAVEDQGAGVPEELVPRLFDRFERGSDGGTGLGLSIARAYAHAHGGDVVYNPASTGARFELILPRTA